MGALSALTRFCRPARETNQKPASMPLPKAPPRHVAVPRDKPPVSAEHPDGEFAIEPRTGLGLPNDQDPPCPRPPEFAPAVWRAGWYQKGAGVRRVKAVGECLAPAGNRRTGSRPGTPNPSRFGAPDAYASARWCPGSSRLDDNPAGAFALTDPDPSGRARGPSRAPKAVSGEAVPPATGARTSRPGDEARGLGFRRPGVPLLERAVGQCRRPRPAPDQGGARGEPCRLQWEWRVTFRPSPVHRRPQRRSAMTIGPSDECPSGPRSISEAARRRRVALRPRAGWVLGRNGSGAGGRGRLDLGNGQDMPNERARGFSQVRLSRARKASRQARKHSRKGAAPSHRRLFFIACRPSPQIGPLPPRSGIPSWA